MGYSKIMNSEIFNLLSKCNCKLDELKSKIFEQENKITDISSESSDLKRNIFSIKKNINEMNNYIYFLFSGYNQNDKNNENKIEKNYKKEKNNIEENSKKKISKNTYDLILNDILPNIKSNANDINKSLDRQLKKVDKADENFDNSFNIFKKINKLI